MYIQQGIPLFYSTFDGNVAPSGAAVQLGYYDARMDNVSFSNHQGSAIRVSIHLSNPHLFQCVTKS